MSSQSLDERGRFSELQPVGVIDIGSNSVRMVIYEGAVRAITPLFNEKVLCGLGRDVAATGALGDDAMALAYQALGRFRAILTAMHVRTIRAFATAAVREASNGDAFLKRGSQLIGSTIRVLSGDEEAESAAKGIMMAFRNPDGVVGDLGGGSLELMNLCGDRTDQSTSLPLGGLRLIEASGGRVEKAGRIVDKALEEISWLDVGRDRPFYAVGGTWRAFAGLHMERSNYPLHVMQGYRIPIEEAMSLALELQKAEVVADIDHIGAVSKSRREILPFGAAALERVLHRLRPSEIIVSVFGVREGIIYDLLNSTERRKDPLISFCTDYARLRSRSLEHAIELCAWTDRIFEHGELAETPDERRLRHAACLISDIAWRAHPDYRGEQSLNVVAHAALTGIDHPGRIFLALSTYHRHVGKNGNGADSFSAQARRVLSKRSQKRAKILGLAIRAAHMLAVGTAG
ncbi:MAG: Ppx/GppA phosphatase family protein, partial [Pseudomonadota bacterium]